MYVLRRNEDGAFVAPPGSASSYTHNLRRARTFYTRDQAEREACGNEHAVRVDAMISQPR